jgi:hypothetical protein
MSSASVRKISNGFIITSAGSTAIPSTLYAATIAEVPYWLAKVFDPIVTAAPQIGIPPTMQSDTETATVTTFASGGFLVTHTAVGGRVEVYCANLDAVADTLTQVFTPVAPP